MFLFCTTLLLSLCNNLQLCISFVSLEDGVCTQTMLHEVGIMCHACDSAVVRRVCVCA